MGARLFVTVQVAEEKREKAKQMCGFAYIDVEPVV